MTLYQVQNSGEILLFPGEGKIKIRNEEDIREMGITGKKELEKPILEILADGKEWERMALVDELAVRLNLTEAELAEGLKGERARTKSESKLYRYANRAMEHLQSDGLIENPEHSIWKIVSFKK